MSLVFLAKSQIIIEKVISYNKGASITFMVRGWKYTYMNYKRYYYLESLFKNCNDIFRPKHFHSISRILSLQLYNEKLSIKNILKILGQYFKICFWAIWSCCSDPSKTIHIYIWWTYVHKLHLRTSKASHKNLK